MGCSQCSCISPYKVSSTLQENSNVAQVKKEKQDFSTGNPLSEKELEEIENEEIPESEDEDELTDEEKEVMKRILEE